MISFENRDSSNIPLQLSQNCVIASIQVDLTDEVNLKFREELLDFLHATGADAVILDVSGVELMDLEDFAGLRKTISMVRIMGGYPVISGLRPGVVSSLIELGAETDDIDAVLDLDEAFLHIHEVRSTKKMSRHESGASPDPGKDQ
jgi:rsbT antagonist protein RsbS